jgi:hypothetical protein
MSKNHKKPGTVSITEMEPPILQECKSKEVKLWTISAEKVTTKE